MIFSGKNNFLRTVTTSFVLLYISKYIQPTALKIADLQIKSEKLISECLSKHLTFRNLTTNLLNNHLPKMIILTSDGFYLVLQSSQSWIFSISSVLSCLKSTLSEQKRGKENKSQCLILCVLLFF